jgi:hypothetical protein
VVVPATTEPIDAGEEDGAPEFGMEAVDITEENKEALGITDETAGTEFAESDDDELPEKDAELAGALGIQLDPTRDLSLDTTDEDIEAELAEGEKESADGLPAFVIPQKDLEAAIERVIETKLAAKIDGLLNQAIEKAVTTEISRLKRLLTDSLSE